MRLIDESSVIENIEEWIDSVGNVVIGRGLLSYAELMGCVEEAPTVEAEPVRYGHWIKAIESYECSECGDYYFYRHNCCPSCGAKMDGGEE